MTLNSQNESDVASVEEDDLPGYKAVTDHGLEVDFTLPSIPCSKYKVIGNPKMRVKRDVVRADPGARRHRYWKIPKLVQSTLATKLQLAKEDEPADADKDAMKLPRVVVIKTKLLGRGRVNSLDKGSLYSARSEDSFKDIDDEIPRKKVIEPEDERMKTERNYISRYYRQRSSALLSPIQKKRSSITLRVPVPDIASERLPPYLATGATCLKDSSRKRPSLIQLHRYHTKPCLYCDVAGQKYCSECTWRHRKLRMKEAFAEAGRGPSGSKVEDGGIRRVDPASETNKNLPVIQQVNDTIDGLRKDHTVVKETGRRKSRAKSIILPRIDLPGTV